jgi:hypothetical protein
MIRKMLPFVLLTALVMSAGCAPTSQYSAVSDIRNQCPPFFRIGEVMDSSGYTPGKDDPAISPAEHMKATIEGELAKKGYFAENGESIYTLDVVVLEYSPGNAFARWLMPGLGATRLRIGTTLTDCMEVKIAEIPVEMNVAAGGGYTIGAWEHVFTDVAKSLVQDLEKNVLKK